MKRTQKITNYEGCELKASFDASETGALESIILSGNNAGAVVGVECPSGGAGSPATAGYQIIDFGGTLTGSTTFASLGFTNQTYYFNFDPDHTGGPSTEPLQSDQAFPFDGTYGFDSTVTIDNFITIANSNPISAIIYSLDNGNLKVTSKTTGVNSNVSHFTPSTTPYLYESATGFIGYDTPVNGTDAVAGAGDPITVKLEYSIDTRAALNADTAVWSDAAIEVDTGEYKEKVFAHPVSAVRLNVTVAEEGMTANVLVRTAK